MTYIIVFKDGSIQRFISVDYCDTGDDIDHDSIVIYCNCYTKQYLIKKEDIASVVYYP